MENKKELDGQKIVGGILIDINQYEKNCDGILRDTHIRIDSQYTIFRKEIEVDALLVGEPMFFGDNFDEVRFIKESKITLDGRLCELKTEPVKLHLDDIYRSYLESILSYEEFKNNLDNHMDFIRSLNKK